MSRPVPAIVGRDHELQDVFAFLDRVEGGPSALVLEGSAGIGKTTIWVAGVQAARTRSYRVLTTLFGRPPGDLDEHRYLDTWTACAVSLLEAHGLVGEATTKEASK